MRIKKISQITNDLVLADLVRERYRSIVEESHIGIVIVDDSYHTIYANDAYLKISGRAREETIGQDFRGVLTEESKELIEDRYERRQRGEPAPSRYELDVIRADGQIRRLEILSSVFKDKEGRALSTAQILDVTEQKRAEEALRESEEKYRLLVEQMRDGVALGVNRILRYVNPRLAEMLGYTPEEMLGQHWDNFVHPDALAKLNEERAKRLQGQSSTYESILVAKDGRAVPVIVSAAPFYGADGSYQGALGVFTDRSELKRSKK
ncbi:MAG: PAS domain-containing protein [Candidatus Hodarchaeales archaeon]|jgi:PAS domain S-box-containing protein